MRLLPSGREIAVYPDQTVLEAALAQSLPFPHQCKAALCASCRCELLRGEIAARRSMHRALTDAALADGQILACQAEPRSDLVIRVDARGNQPIV